MGRISATRKKNQWLSYEERVIGRGEEGGSI